MGRIFYPTFYPTDAFYDRCPLGGWCEWVGMPGGLYAVGGSVFCDSRDICDKASHFSASDCDSSAAACDTDGAVQISVASRRRTTVL